MGVLTITDDISSPVPASKLFKALILDGDHLVPKIAPQAIKSIEIIQGDGGPGTIKQTNFTEGSPFKSVKHRVDLLDKEKMTYAYTMFEGDALMGILESVSFEIKLEPSQTGGCIGKKISKYNTKPGIEIKEEDVKAGKDKVAGVFKAVEAYILANPDAYA